MRIRPLLALLAGAPAMLRAQDTFSGVERVVAVGDVHGDYEQFVLVLRQAKVVDDKTRWIGGKTHLVQTGDILDRGPDSRRVMELLMDLAGQAKKAGGHVHALIGNHEVMNVLGDLRYVAPGEYAAFRSGNSAALQERAFAVLSDTARRADPAYKTQWFTEHPLGWVEHRMAFEGNGRYASWIRGNNAVVKINNMIFLHGGIGPKYAAMPLRDINQGVRRVLDPTKPPAEGNIAEDADGPLWFRGLTSGDEALLAGHVDSVLSRLGADHMVIGHTVTAGTILPRYAGKVIMIDVGLSAAYGGPPAALIVEQGAVYTLHRGQQLALPLGGDLVPYLKAAAALDPPPSRLGPYIDQLMAARAVPR